MERLRIEVQRNRGNFNVDLQFPCLRYCFYSNIFLLIHKGETISIIDEYLITVNVIAVKRVINNNNGGCRLSGTHERKPEPFCIIEILVGVLFHLK